MGGYQKLTCIASMLIVFPDLGTQVNEQHKFRESDGSLPFIVFRELLCCFISKSLKTSHSFKSETKK